jgi:pimeloyl-ACP methyl ester carboxylesterase
VIHLPHAFYENSTQPFTKDQGKEQFMRYFINTIVLVLTLTVAVHAGDFTGTKSTWHGFDRYDFSFDGKPTYVAVPKVAAPGNPWVMRVGFTDYHEEVDAELLARGYHVVEMNIVNMMGSPTAVGLWNDLYQEMTVNHNLSSKAVLEGTSRGGLLIHNWATQNPEKVQCLVGYVPVCDIKSWPGGHTEYAPSTGLGNPAEWQNLLREYGLTEAQALAYDKNPIDTLAPLAAAGVPILHLVGDSDPYVPMTENAQIVYNRYRAMGGNMQLIVVPGGDHAAWISDVSPIVNFITPEPSVIMLMIVGMGLLRRRS